MINQDLLEDLRVKGLNRTVEDMSIEWMLDSSKSINDVRTKMQTLVLNGYMAAVKHEIFRGALEDALKLIHKTVADSAIDNAELRKEYADTVMRIDRLVDLIEGANEPQSQESTSEEVDQTL